MNRPPLLKITIFLYLALTTASAFGEVVVCTATKGFHCSDAVNCKPDATYLTSFRVDRENNTVECVSNQHTVRDMAPKPDGTTYKIMF